MPVTDLNAVIEFDAFSGTVSDLARFLRTNHPDWTRELIAELNRGRSEKVQVQSGMESKHEAWVLATLNFLTGMDIPFYTRDARGNRVKGGDLDIPARLELLKEKVLTAGRRERDALATARELQEDKRRLEARVEGYVKLLGSLAEQVLEVIPVPDRVQDIVSRLQEAQKPPEAPRSDPSGS